MENSAGGASGPFSDLEHYARERDALLERILQALRADPRVGAVWLSGSLTGVGKPRLVLGVGLGRLPEAHRERFDAETLETRGDLVPEVERHDLRGCVELLEGCNFVEVAVVQLGGRRLCRCLHHADITERAVAPQGSAAYGDLDAIRVAVQALRRTEVAVQPVGGLELGDNADLKRLGRDP